VGLNELLWRFNAGNNYLKAAVLTFLIFGGALLLNVKSVPDFQGLPIVQIITLLGFIWSFSKLISSSLLPGSAKAAHSFIEENSKDPMNALASHFEKLIERIGSPVAIFIDDLDRCNRDYGIKLLEGLQTIFKRAPVIYVIAADRKWLKIMYEDQYSMFAPALAKPAKPFGLVFLDKIFQLVVELPDISAIQKRIYWNKLLNISNPDEPKVTEVEVNEIKRKVESAPHNSDKLDIANNTEGSVEKKQIAREQAISSVSIREEEKILEHKLQNFIDLIEPNPRAMKRLINDVSTAKAVTYLYDQNIDTDQLILWTILKQEHPSLAEFFWNNPEKINEALSYTDITKPFTNNKEHDELLGREDIKNLFQYSVNGRKLKLDNEFLEKMKFKDSITLLSNPFKSTAPTQR
ncbi:MAG TPA: P-loop NTPase fold protein, partial [Chitinophagaceae bacterium]|nr:P-loop NTPase fold protein [Chitinophagaceae bacterium]